MGKLIYITTAATAFGLITAISDAQKAVAVMLLSLIGFQFFFTVRRDANRGSYAPDVLPLPEPLPMTPEEHAAAIRDAAAIFEINRRDELRQIEAEQTAIKEAERKAKFSENTENVALDFDISYEPQNGFDENIATGQVFYQKKVK